MQNNNVENLKIKGEYTAISLASWVQKNSETFNAIKNAVRTQNKILLDAFLETGAIQQVKFVENIIPTSGRAVLARLLAGDTTFSGEVDWGALGNGATPSFTNSSTQLHSEIARSQADSQSFDENIAYIDWFWAFGDIADGVYSEFGAFIDGSASANSGQAWSLLATGGWTKSGSMYISAKYTLI